MGAVTQLIYPSVDAGHSGDIVREAVALLSPRWQLSSRAAVRALFEVAEDLDVEVTDLSALVVLSDSCCVETARMSA